MIKPIFILLLLAFPSFCAPAQNPARRDTTAKNQPLSETVSNLERATDKHRKAAEKYANEAKAKEEGMSLRAKKLIAGLIAVAAVMVYWFFFKKKRYYGRQE